MSALTPRRDPVRLAFSKATWSAAWYLLAYLFTGTALFSIALTAALTGAALSITLAGLPVLVAAAIDAVKKWVYHPTLLNGNPVEVETEIDVNFTLAQ